MKFILALIIAALLLSACAYNKEAIQPDVTKIHEPLIKHEPSGAMVKVADGISLEEAKKVIDFVYNDFKSLEGYIGNGRGFTTIDRISHWPTRLYPRPNCKYIVDFYYPVTPRYSVGSGNSGDTLCIGIRSNKFILESTEHWVE